MAETAARTSLRRSLLVWLSALFGLGMLALFVAARAWSHAAADESYDRLLAASALSIAGGISAPQGGWTVDLPYAALDLLSMAPEDRVFYRVADPGGAALTGYDDLPPPPRVSGAKAAADKPVFYDARYRGEVLRLVSLERWIATGERRGTAQVQVGQTRIARDAMAEQLLLRALLPIGAMTVAALLLVWAVVSHALRPLLRLERSLLAREPSDLSPLRGAVPAELAQLVAAFNSFIARFSDHLDRLRSFIAEAAHQIRTPLAALHAQAQLAVDEPDAAQQQRSLASIERNGGHLVRLVNQMLSDASVSHRATLRRFEALDLAAIVREAIDETLPRADPAPDIRLSSIVTTAPSRGDALMLLEAIKNLIDNAIRHGLPQNGPIEVSLQAAPSPPRWRLTVADRGPGIAGDPAPLFARFARGQGAAAGGAGLGLAIVQRVVQSHGGTVALQPREGRGLCVCVELPAMAP